ncbi:AAA family ATPase, partial [Candidatus Dojkabacteria bacterium]|nr:AAA family ATPase [Candidatus Dojkabacteria bacterium]
IIFIDEIDAVAKKRGTVLHSGAGEQTLNQILVEMDGFEKNDNVIVIAATNRPDVLDPALLRPGRFDRRVMLDMPDVEGRKQILEIHAKGKPLATDVNLETVAKRTVGFSGADLENMLNESAIMAAKKEQATITQQDIEEAATKVTMGPEKKRRKSKRDLEITAYHEAGHALVSKFVPEADPVHRVSIISRGMAGGVTMYLPKQDEDYYTKTKLVSKIKTLVAGHVAEQTVFGDVTTGAASDIKQASSLARKMVKQFGMSAKLGFVRYGTDDESDSMGYAYGGSRDYSEATAKEIDEEVLEIIDGAYKEVEKLILKHRETLDKVAKTLLDKEVIEGKEFDLMFEKNDKLVEEKSR